MNGRFAHQTFPPPRHQYYPLSLSWLRSTTPAHAPTTVLGLPLISSPPRLASSRCPFLAFQATARAASGSLTPAHGGGAGRASSAAVAASGDTDGRRGPNDGGHVDEKRSSRTPQITGYVGSVRDDLTAFVSAEREAAASDEGGAGAVGRTLAILSRLGEDLGRMVRLKGRVEHQVRTVIRCSWER